MVLRKCGCWELRSAGLSQPKSSGTKQEPVREGCVRQEKSPPTCWSHTFCPPFIHCPNRVTELTVHDVWCPHKSKDEWDIPFNSPTCHMFKGWVFYWNCPSLLLFLGLKKYIIFFPWRLVVRSHNILSGLYKVPTGRRESLTSSVIHIYILFC